jgi:serine/threonine-protein kinase
MPVFAPVRLARCMQRGERCREDPVTLPACEAGIALPERYEDLGQIGAGGMGEVRRVRDRPFHRVLALKTMHARWVRFPTAVSRFVAEAQLTAQLQHPGIVAVHDMGYLADGRFYFTMREVSGAHLGAWIASGPPPPSRLRWLLERFVAACKAVAYAHSRGVVHRDLKPENVLLGEFGDVVVIDWGLARVGPSSTGDNILTVRSTNPSARTDAGAIGGTQGFRPPEQERGDVQAIGPWTDTWALGAILRDILVGGEPLRPLADEHDVPPGLRAIAERALAPEIGDRFPTAAALTGELVAWLEGHARGPGQAEILLERARDRLGRIPRAEASEARVLAAQVLQLATAALVHAPDHPEAQAMIAAHYFGIAPDGCEAPPVVS